MRTTLILDDALVEKARRLSGFKEKTAVVHAGLEALIARESARRLAVRITCATRTPAWLPCSRRETLRDIRS